MYSSTVPGTCFLSVIYSFNGHETAPTVFEGGAGWCVAGFIDEPRCKHMYNKMNEKYPILYQSEVRRNSNTGRQCFFVIYNTSKAQYGNGMDWFDRAPTAARWG